MTRSKLGLLGFCAVMLGLLAFNTGIASATVGSNWLILMSNGEVLTGAQLTATLQLSRDTTIVLHSKILGLAVLFECEKIEALNANLLKNGTVAKEFNAEGKPVGAQIKFSECITKLNGETTAACQPNAGGTEPGVIKTNLLHGLLVLHILKNEKGEEVGKDDLILVLPDTGETLATLEFSAACAVGKKVPIIGSFTLKDCEGNASFLTHKVIHLLELGPLDPIWVISKTVEHEATILGSWFAFLIGPHLNLPWSGDPL
jgi:hypothetical protein